MSLCASPYVVPFYQGCDYCTFWNYCLLILVIKFQTQTQTMAAERSDYTMVWEGRALFTHNGCPPTPLSIWTFRRPWLKLKQLLQCNTRTPQVKSKKAFQIQWILVKTSSLWPEKCACYSKTCYQLWGLQKIKYRGNMKLGTAKITLL